MGSDTSKIEQQSEKQSEKQTVPQLPPRKQKSHSYFLFDRGVHIGKLYNLPRNVRVLMPCNIMTEESGTGKIPKNKCPSVSSENKTKILQSCFMDVDNDKYLEKMKDTFCIYDGNTPMNRVPDFIFNNLLRFSPDTPMFTFLTGICEMPFDLNYITITPKCSKNKSINETGSINPLDKQYVFDLCEKYLKREQITDEEKEMFDYFVMGKKSESFTIVPNLNNNRYYSKYSLGELNGRTKQCLNESLPKKLTDIRTKPGRLGDYITNPGTSYDDVPPNATNDLKNTIREAIKKYEISNNIYLSDIINFLCNKYETEQITLVISTCRFIGYSSDIYLKGEQIEIPTIPFYGDRVKNWGDWLLRKEASLHGFSIEKYIKGDYTNLKGGYSNNNFYHKYLKYKIKYQSLQ